MYYKGVLGAELRLAGVEVMCSKCNRRSWTTQTIPTHSRCCRAPMHKTGRRAEAIPKDGEFMPRTKDKNGTIPTCSINYFPLKYG